MRNLQKILALVLALMMSVSLVATAGAFSDDGDITDVYKDAVTVLNGLDVFKGYDNGATFQPKGNITRAEVAAIIYRIATGDVTDSQASIYSTYGQFTDVADGSWYSGYVNYCANAGYIKGRGNKIFDPQGQVTGYEALAMILRAVGYDKNGEFTGSNWQIRTASIANERGITKNVTSAQLGQAATRETVAEILFRSIVIPKVNFNANTLSYTEKPLNADGKKDTLGYESLKLEEITGIVTANEYADLDNSVTLNADKTRMRVSGVDGGNYILDYGEATLLEGLDAIGEEHNAYIQNANTTSAKVLLMAKTDNNKTYETLEKVEIDTDSKFREKTGLQRSETATEHYLNFDEVKDWRSDWRIKYVISSVNTVANTIDEVNREISRINANTNFELPTLANLNADTLARAGYALIPDGTTGRFFIEYTKEFRVDTTIGSVDRGNIEEIFNIADRLTKNDYVRGEVYVGTSSLKDISDEISYKQFVEQYINNDGDKKITKNENGNWLKVIDNDNDGQADYVLKVVYTMAQVVRASGGEYGLDTEDLSLNDGDEVNFLDDDDAVSEDTLVLDDIVYYAVIDGVPRATKAESATVKIDTVNRKDLRVTTTDSVEYVESGVHGNHVVSPDYTCGVTNMNGSATYDIYLDRGGYLALFTDSHGGDFTLIVDGWYNSTKGGIEYAVRAYNDETGRQDVVDVTRGGGMFIGRDVQWTDQVDNNDWRALKWLGNTNGTEALTNRDTATGTYGAGKLNGEGYANTNDVKTTVATLTDDGMIQPVDYTSVGSKVVRMLATKNNEIPDSSASYQAEVYTTGSSLNTTDTAYDTLLVEDAELRALSTTVYYLVYPSKNAESGFAVEKYTGYASVPSVDDGFIEDVYAVATRQDRTSTLGGRTYYTADVVVVELKSTFRGYAEQVFIYNMPEAGNRVGIESVDLIHENGENETGVKIDFALSNVRDYRVAHDVNSSLWKTTNWRPGLYYLYPTNTADLYTVQPMDANDIAQNDYVVGWSSTSDATAKTDHVSVIAFSNDVHVGGANTEIAYGEVTKAVSNVYRIGYDSKGIADLSTYKLDEGNLLSFVDERVDVTSGVNTYDYNKYDHYPYDRENHPNACDICWNQNLILMHYTGNTANYTISFENDNSLAEDVWSNNMPSTLAWNDAGDTNKNLSRDDAVSYAQFMLKCADPANDANGLPTNVYYNARYHIDQAVKTAMAGTLEVKKNRVDSVADNLITQLKGSTPVEYTVSVNVTVDGVAVPAADVATYVTGVPTGTVAAGSAYTLTLTDAALAYNVSVDGTAHTGNTITGTATGNVTHTIALTTKGTTTMWTVTATLTNVTANPAIPANVNDTDTVTTTLTADAGYNLPATVTVTIGGTAAVAGTDYTYDPATGALTISNVSGDVVITAAGVAETPVEKTITVTIQANPEILEGVDNPRPVTSTVTKTVSTANTVISFTTQELTLDDVLMKVITGITASGDDGAFTATDTGEKETYTLDTAGLTGDTLTISVTYKTSSSGTTPGGVTGDGNTGDITEELDPTQRMGANSRARTGSARASVTRTGRLRVDVKNGYEIDWDKTRFTSNFTYEKDKVRSTASTTSGYTTWIIPFTVTYDDAAGEAVYGGHIATKDSKLQVTLAWAEGATVPTGAAIVQPDPVVEGGNATGTVTLPSGWGLQAEPASAVVTAGTREGEWIVTVERVSANMDVVLTPVQGAVSVTVSVAEDSTNDVDLLSTAGGVRRWVKTYSDTSATVDGTITVTAKVTAGAPFIVGNDDVIFTESNGEWTAEVPVTSAEQVIYVSAKDYQSVTLTRGDGITFVSPEVTTLTATKYAFEDSEGGYGPVTFTVDVADGRVPVIREDTANALTNWTVDTDAVAGSSNRWTISFTGNDSVSGALTGITVIAGMGNEIRLSRNSDDVQLDTQTKYPVSGGKATVTVYVRDGMQPTFAKSDKTPWSGDIKLTKFADDTYKGWNRWTAELSGIGMSQDILVGATASVYANITIASGAVPYVQKKETQQTKVEIINGEGSFEIYVDPTYAPIVGSNPTDKSKVTFTTDEFDKPTEWVKWTVNAKDFTASDTAIEIGATKSYRVALNHPTQLQLDAEAKHTGSVWADTNGDGTLDGYWQEVTFIATVPAGSMPVVNDTTALGSCAVVINPGDAANTWEITFEGVSTAGTVYVDLSVLPEISVISDSTGIIFNSTSNVVRDGSGESAKYNATLTFELKEGYNLNKDIEVYKDGGSPLTTNYNVTSINRIGTSNRYEIRITLSNSGGGSPVDFENSLVSVKVGATKVWKATLVTDAAGHISLRNDEPVSGVKEVEEGSYAVFYVTVDTGWLIKASDSYSVEAVDSSWKITSANPVSGDITITLESEAATNWRYTVNASSDATVTMPDGTTQISGGGSKTDTIKNGTVELTVNTSRGVVPTVTVDDPNGVPSAVATLEYVGGANSGSENVWTVTLSDVVANPTVTIDVKQIVAGTEADVDGSGDGKVEVEGGRKIDEITVGINSDDDASRDVVSKFDVAIGKTIDLDEFDKNDEVSFIVYVADGFVIEDQTGSSSWNWDYATVRSYTGGNSIHQIDGYQAMVVTIKKNNNFGSDPATVTFPVGAPAGSIPTK